MVPPAADLRSELASDELPADRGISVRRTQDRHRSGFIIVVFAVIAVAVSASFAVYWSQPPQTPPSSYIVFQSPALVGGNASFAVQSVSGGPYASTGFQVNLVVNNFAGQPIPLGPSSSTSRIKIGPNTYRITWLDSDINGAVSAGDPFLVSGDGEPLPSLSVYEFNLKWQNSWTSQTFWSTP